jgi:glycosyltransferase involved in cell wall biosynthesis
VKGQRYKMKKVLIVTPSLIQGGGQKFVVDLAKTLDKSKYQVKLLVYYKESNSVFDQAVIDNNIDALYLDKKVGLDFSFFAKVRKVLKEYKPDVIHSNLDTMLYLLPFYKRGQIKIHTVHNMAEKESVKLQRLVRNIAYKIKHVIPVAISDIVCDSIVAVHKLKRDNIPIVYNGVECSRYKCTKERNPQKTLNFINVGSIHRVKNLSFLIDCFSELVKENKNVHLTLVGDGVLRKNIEDQIEKLNLQDYVTITGIVKDVENYLAYGDVYVASSIFEGLPISILEAMSAGLPVISTNVGGVPDIIKNDQNGILVELGDSSSYLEAMKLLVENENKRYELSENALKESLKYDISIMAKGYENIYQ